MCEYTPYEGVTGRCAHCGSTLTGRQTRWCGDKCITFVEMQHAWAAARRAAMARDGWKCVRCGSMGMLEVNHIIPRYGQGYKWGCHNHVAGLETLCRAHHQQETNRQRKARR